MQELQTIREEPEPHTPANSSCAEAVVAVAALAHLPQAREGMVHNLEVAVVAVARVTA
jgi:hypothetical protein